MDKEQKHQEGEKLLPDVEPRRHQPPNKDIDPMPDRELEYNENSNKKFRDQTGEKNE